ncbi:hypothetical protein [Nocardia sp. NPDC051463]|uniref:hypothetical protein n=1 Tax=Nocardia sp. NPDC051463 TaxID=3154845 RepID=UPI00344CB444
MASGAVLPRVVARGPGTAVTFFNGGDNIGISVPVFATAGTSGYTSWSSSSSLSVPGASRASTSPRRPVIDEALSRWGHVPLPVVLIGKSVCSS